MNQHHISSYGRAGVGSPDWPRIVREYRHLAAPYVVAEERHRRLLAETDLDRQFAEASLCALARFVGLAAVAFGQRIWNIPRRASISRVAAPGADLVGTR
jgi:hypothetical protein